MMTMTQKGNKLRNRPSETVITLKTMAAAAKQVQTQGRDDRHQVTVVSCELDFESDEFQSDLAYIVQTEDM